jgi:hypothetical protein
MPTTPDFEHFCADVIGEPISFGWNVFYRVVEGLPLTAEQAALYCASTGRPEYVPRIAGFQEATGICGRRSEKTQTCIKFLLWKIAYGGYEKQFRPSWFARLGRHTRLLRIPLILQDTRVARDVLRTAESLALGSPLLSEEIAESFRSELIFKNGLALTTFPATKASVRSLACPAALLDELAFVSIEGADDKELVRQLRPSMIEFGQTRRLIKLSTPWQRSGILYEEYSQRLERSDLLVWQASTQTMTPRISVAELERERLSDASYFAREFLAEFTADRECFIPFNDTLAAIQSWKELAPVAGPYYIAALDASSVTGGDRFTFGVAHSDKGGHFVDVLRGWQKATVGEVCDEIAQLCKAYRVEKVIADQFGFAFLHELMRQRGVELAQLVFTARSKPEIFFALKSALSTGKFNLPNHPEGIRELRALESTRLSGGNYRICAPGNLHDDYATTLALLAYKIADSVPKQPWSSYLVAGEPKTAVDQNAPRPSPYRVTNDRWANLGANDCGPERWWHRI